MTVVSNNSNALPMTQAQVYGSQTTVPSTAKRGSYQTPGVILMPIKAPTQVVGLVPLYPCCDDPTATFYWKNTDNANVVTFHLIINGVDVGTINSVGTASAATNQAAIQAILPTGITCSVIGVAGAGFHTWKTTLYAPNNTWANVTVSLGSVVGTDVYGYTNFTSAADCGCRRSGYKADSVPDDTQWTIPAIASSTDTDQYKNDKNTWLLQYPIGYNAINQGDFHLQQYNGSGWATVATLNSTTYGTPVYNNVSPKGTACTNFNYCGYTLDWRKVLIGLGAGTYRFLVGGSYTQKYPYCLASPPFCLQEYSCYTADQTVRFEAYYTGGNFGSVTSQGKSWSLCCQYAGTYTNQTLTAAYTWYDSIRFYGFFGYTTFDITRDQIKYQNGQIYKTRDEAIKKFKLMIGKGGSEGNAPQWLLDRFVAYALQADKLLVSDYNMNNSQYNFNRFWVVADSGFEPKYTTSSRYMKVLSTQFKEGVQFIYRDRCC